MAIRSKYPFLTMAVGDSFELPVDQTDNIRAAIHQMKRKRPDLHFTTRVNDMVIKVWRIADDNEIVLNTSIPVDRGIPLPPIRSISKERAALYPFAGMEVGDSFLIPRGWNVQRVREIASHFAKAHDRKFTTRATLDGVRIWRIE